MPLNFPENGENTSLEDPRHWSGLTYLYIWIRFQQKLTLASQLRLLACAYLPQPCAVDTFLH